jgi:hypothetical protein
MKEYHAVMEAIVVIKMMLDIVRNIHTLMNEYLAETDATVVTRTILDIVQSIHMLTNPDLNLWLV